MRFFLKKARFLLFPLISLTLVSTLTLHTLGIFKTPGKKEEKNVFEKIDDLKRHVASVNKSLETAGEENVQQVPAAQGKPTKKANEALGEMHMESGSSVRSMIEANCYFDILEKTVGSSQIKFDFVDCGQQGSRMKLINKTNGYEAQIFPFRGKKVSSDFIQLEFGSNELLFEISSTAGQIKSQIIKIKRIQ